MSPLHEFLNRLGDLARGLGPSSEGLDFEDKGAAGFDPVTEIDRRIEAAIRATIEDAFPDHRIWGEEQGWSGPPTGAEWSVDPVDGTRALICGLPSWALLVGFIEDGSHVAGLMDFPALGERLIACAGVTYSNGRKVTTSGCSSLAEARLSTTDPYLFADGDRARFDQVRTAALVTRFGLDALAYARVATGGLDLVIENGLKRHDFDAVVPVVRGAGGYVGNWQGGDDLRSGAIVAAASRDLYEAAVDLLSR